MKEDKKVKKTETVSKEDFLKLQRNNDKKTAMVIVLIFIIVLLLLLIVIYFMNGKKLKGQKPTATPVPVAPPTLVDSFVYTEDNYGLSSSGTVYITGYAKVVDNVVNFHITKLENPSFETALKNWGYEQGTISLGCLNNGNIEFRTAADEFGPSEYDGNEEDAHLYYSSTITVSDEVREKILSSNENNNVTLLLRKSPLTHFVSFTNQCDFPMTSIELSGL